MLRNCTIPLWMDKILFPICWTQRCNLFPSAIVLVYCQLYHDLSLWTKVRWTQDASPQYILRKIIHRRKSYWKIMWKSSFWTIFMHETPRQFSLSKLLESHSPKINTELIHKFICDHNHTLKQGFTHKKERSFRSICWHFLDTGYVVTMIWNCAISITITVLFST